MSHTELHRFFTCFTRDRRFRGQVVRVLSGKKERDAARAVARLADQHGFDFTPEEFIAVREQALRYESDDLDADHRDKGICRKLWYRIRDNVNNLKS